jgi:hypothetical protein
MNVNLYLPDELGQAAKEAELPLSQLLRAAVQNELERRKAVSQQLSEPKQYLLSLEDGTTGRLTGTMITGSVTGYQVYLTDDERVIVYDTERERFWEVEEPEEELQDVLGKEDYVDAMRALGLDPIVDI